MKKLSIIIPVYNEKNTIKEILKEVENSNVGGLEKEIIIVDDFSTDGTREILEELEKEKKYKIYFKDKNEGKGSALRFGFQKATGDYIIIQDADLEYDPREYIIILEPLLQNKADVVYGSRFLSSKSRRVLYFWHYVGNKFLTSISNVFTNLNLSDMETCYKAFNKKALDIIKDKVTSDRFGIEPEITALVAKNKLRIYEVGISYSGRTYKEGKKINWKDGLAAFWHIFKFNIFNQQNFDSFKEKSKSFFKSNIFFIFILITINIFVAYFYIKDPFKPFEDSPSYLNAMHYIQGLEVTLPIPYNRILTTPLMLHSSIFVNNIIGNLYYSMMIINIIFYYLIAYVFYKLALEIFCKEKVAFFASIYLVANYCLFNFGIGFGADMGGWFFFVLGTFFAVKYFSNPNKKYFYYLSIFSASIGFFFKEYASLAIVTLICLIIQLQNLTIKEKILKILKTLILFFILPLIYYIIFYFKYKYSYFDWYFYNINEYVLNPNLEKQSRLKTTIKVLGWVFLAGWPIFVYGLWQLKKYYNKKRIKILLAMVPSSLSFLIWPALTQRIAFVAVPLLSLVAGYGLSKIKNNIIVILFLLLYIITNYLITQYLINVINLNF